MQQIKKFIYNLLWFIANAAAPAVPAFAWISLRGSTGPWLYIEVAVALTISFVIACFMDALFYEAQLAGEKVSLLNRALSLIATGVTTFVMSFMGFQMIWPALDLRYLSAISLFFFGGTYLLQIYAERLAVKYGLHDQHTSGR